MKLTVLVDNNTSIDQYFYGEPAVSYYIEDGDRRLLFDVGYSGLFLENARRLSVDLSRIDTLVLSHGHNDHTGGLTFLLNNYPNGKIKVIAHPHTFHKKWDGPLSIGSPSSEEELRKHWDLFLSAKPVEVSENLTFLGEIPQYNDFESRIAIGLRESEKGPAVDYVSDYVTEDSALSYRSEKGLYIITGCSHSGICNIIEHAKRVCSCDDIAGVIGGFHLFEPSRRLTETAKYLAENKIGELYPCHCVSFAAKAEIHRRIPIREVGVGMEVKW